MAFLDAAFFPGRVKSSKNISHLFGRFPDGEIFGSDFFIFLVVLFFWSYYFFGRKRDGVPCGA